MPMFSSRGKKEGDILSRVSREALESPVRDAEENAPQRSAFPSLPTRTKEIFQVSLEPIKARMLLMERIIPKIPAHIACLLVFLASVAIAASAPRQAQGPPQTPLHTSLPRLESYAENAMDVNMREEGPLVYRYLHDRSLRAMYGRARPAALGSAP